MEPNRRRFLQVAGLAALGFVIAKPAISLFSMLHPKETSLASGFLTETGTPATVGTSAQKQLAMAIDIESCKKNEGCTKCIEACHEWHNVPDIDTLEEEIKWIWTDKYEKVFAEHVTEFIDQDRVGLPVMLLCNQCNDPPCVKYCPTRATWKRETDGIIMVDFHRCIGCRYCMAGCPYGARSFNWKNPRPFIDEVNSEYPTRGKGVVEKCNFCADRLDKGLIPACVEACPENALIFGDLKESGSEIRNVLSSHHILRRLPELGTGPNNYYF